MAFSTAVIGAGWIARQHAKALVELGVSIEAVYDVNAENAVKFAQDFGARVVDDPSAAIGKVDMMHLMTPPSRRVEYAKPFMDAGVPIFIEKPVAVDMQDALWLRDYAQKTHTIMIAGFNHRYRRGYQLLSDAVQSGSLGEPVNVYVQRIGQGSGFRAPLSASWRTDPKLVCGMTIESLSHDINMILPLVNNEIDAITGMVYGTVASLPTYDNNANVVFRLKNGGIGSISSSWSSDLPYSVRGFVGTKGTAEIRGGDLWDLDTFTIKTEGMDAPRVIQVGEKFATTSHASYVAINKHFLDCIQNKTQPLTGIDDGVNALRFSLAVLESSKTGAAVKW